MIVGLKKYGKTPTAHLQDLGLLGPDFVAAHGVWLDADDIQRLADHGASVAHNPGSNMLLGNGIAAVRTMLDRKLNVGIGTDGASCCDNQNMYELLRVAAYGSNAKGPDTDRWLSSEEILQAATIGSARALGFADKLGMIAKGTKPTSSSSTSPTSTGSPATTRPTSWCTPKTAVLCIPSWSEEKWGDRTADPSASTFRPSPEKPKPRESAFRRSTPATRLFSNACKASSTASAPGSPRPPTTSTILLAPTTRIEGQGRP